MCGADLSSVGFARCQNGVKKLKMRRVSFAVATVSGWSCAQPHFVAWKLLGRLKEEKGAFNFFSWRAEVLFAKAKKCFCVLSRCFKFGNF